MKSALHCATAATFALLLAPLIAQPPDGFGGGPPGGPSREKAKLVEEFDDNDDGWLNSDERAAARKALADRPQRERRGGRGPGGFGPPGGFGLPGGFGGGGDRTPPEPGPPIDAGEVVPYADAPLYDTDVLRTVFIDFESDNWETELEAFKETDVEVPATLTVDGVEYSGVGVRFRGMSSYMMVPRSFKRSLNVSLDLVDSGQRLYGYKTLNLLNGNGDASMMSTVLYSEIANQYTPAPKANFVEVVINGESWGLYTNVQQFDKVFLKESYGSSKGTRWKVPGSPGADGGLRYLGDDLDEYKSRYEMKSSDGKKAWRALVELCRVLNETPLDRLEEELAPILDIDGALRFLALDVALVNSDGYWTRASDYYLFRDGEGVFHLIPHDMNEAFHGAGGPPGFGGPRGFGRGRPPEGFGPPPGFGPPDDALDRRAERSNRSGEGRRGGRGGHGFGPPNHGSVDLDPFVGLDNDRTPLRSRLLAVPALKERYLEYVQQIAGDSLAWDHLGPQVHKYRELIHTTVERDTRKLTSTEAFLAATSSDAVKPKTGLEGKGRGGVSLRGFSEARTRYLLNYQEPPAAPSEVSRPPRKERSDD
ncbi:CotH kinase family protein [Botrimarina mediterranea]|uniref:Inner spore coat protein H n=1 Tax=Botrimarina mediterranea TaxID=2528022 RepID=A0A518K9K1_9BACT|nr:CotH kinase family protein [Botrimarina mediterranea]QDV74469.1 Inner spore coat protein H [Botrimarina mediterranea]QDV79065.1 Inner spore coat protein H [Planctomycetes bacterium K2D]